MRFSTQIGEKTVAIHCQEDLGPFAEGLLAYLKETFMGHSDQLNDGYKIQFGWTLLKLQQQKGDLVLFEPNYQSDPFTEWRNEISTSLAVAAQQNEILKQTEAEGVPALFQDKIVMAQGSVDEEKIYLYRSKAPSEGDSGWYIAPVEMDEGEEPEYEAMFVFELLQRRPALLKVLLLPPGYMVVFQGDQIEGWRHQPVD
ncbi:Hypothetical protein PBC10988_23460 [Planctomycetales bacterium 10988]|nr:Hypothetical protein PBC10988_23460 [Planctomycetales bacterium 10988]